MLKFLRKTEKTAKSVSEAVELALAELEVGRDEVEITVLDEGAKGFLGIGAKDAHISAEIKNVNAAVAKKFLSQIFAAMKMDVEIIVNTDGDMVNIELAGDNMGIVIGKRGDTLDGLQYLTSLVVNSFNDDYIKVTIDTENYRQKRHDTLIALSERLAQKVEKTGRKQILEPMNPYERRIIHANLQSNEKITTYSIGDEPYRKVVIALKNPRPYTKKSSYNHSSYGKKSTYGGYKSYETEYKSSYDSSNEGSSEE